MITSLPVPNLPTETSDDLLASPAQVVVLGMHRSGTSAVTRVLNLMGCWAGPEGAFAPADEANPTGYWEHRDVWTLDEAVLQALGATWCQTNGFDLARLDAESRARFAERVRDFAAAMDRSGPWVIKDPRLCLLFPLWRPALERPVCILVHRDPLPVARSLESRDGLPILHGIALWELYNREALAATRGLPRILVSYRDLLEAPLATARRLYAQMLPFAGERLHLPDERELSSFVQPPLDHHPPDPDLERGYLNLSQSELLRAFATGTALDLD
ncbi:MAG TPA: sulfotransferase, partial [Thermoanaerobaculia bacterium]